MERREHVELWAWRLAEGVEYRAEAHAPGTREIVHVTAGRLRLTVDAVIHDLDPGDSVLFSADRPHAYAGAAADETRFQMVVVMPPAAVD